MLDEIEVIKQVGRKIKAFRKQQKITQSQLAFEAHIPRIQIIRIEKGDVNTTIKTLTQIGNALGVHPKDLLDF